MLTPVLLGEAMTTYHAPADAVAHDLINRPTWSSPTVVRESDESPLNRTAQPGGSS